MINSETQLKKKLKQQKAKVDLQTILDTIDQINRGEIKKADAARKNNVDKGTISKWLKKESKIRKQVQEVGHRASKRFRVRAGKFVDLDERMLQWFKFMRARFPVTKLPVSKAMIKIQALKYAGEMGLSQTEFSASDGWVNQWKNRFGLKNINLHGEMGDVDIKEGGKGNG